MILSTEQIKVLKENKNLITSEILSELRKTKEGKSVALEILDIEKDSEDYYLDAFGGRIAFNGNRQIKPFHTKINLSDIHIQEIKRCSEDIDYFTNNYVSLGATSDGNIRDKATVLSNTLVNFIKEEALSKLNLGKNYFDDNSDLKSSTDSEHNKINELYTIQAAYFECFGSITDARNIKFSTSKFTNRGSVISFAKNAYALG